MSAWPERGRPAGVIEAHDRDVTRDGQPGFGDGLKATDGHEVVGEEKAVRRQTLPEQLPGGCIAALGPEVSVGKERGIKRAPSGPQCRPVPGQPSGAGRGLDRSGDDPDPPGNPGRSGAAPRRARPGGY